MAMLALSLLLGLFSSCNKQGLLSRCGAQVYRCGGLSCCGAQALEHVGCSSGSSRVLGRQFSGCGTQASLLSCIRILPDQGLEPMLLVSGRFLQLDHQRSPLLMYLTAN